MATRADRHCQTTKENRPDNKFCIQAKSFIDKCLAREKVSFLAKIWFFAACPAVFWPFSFSD